MAVEVSAMTVKLDTSPLALAATRLKALVTHASSAEKSVLLLETRTRTFYNSALALVGLLGKTNSGLKYYADFSRSAASELKGLNAGTAQGAKNLDRMANAAERAATNLSKYRIVSKGLGTLPGPFGPGGGGGGGTRGGGGAGGGFRARFGGISNFGPFSGGMLTSLPSGAAAPVAAAVVAASAIAAATAAAAALVEKTVEVAMAFEKIKNTLGVGVGFDKVGQEMLYLRGLSDKMGLSLLSTAQGYAQMTAASKGTKLEGDATKKVFEGLTKASTAMQWSGQDMSLALLAVTQMISKGKVSSEELRRQLGERMPGAMRMAADAMGMTTKEFERNIKAGKIMTDEFLPKFAEQMEKKFGPAAEVAADSLRANFNRMETAVQSFFLSLDQFGISGGVKDVIKGIAKGVNELAGRLDQLAKSPAGQNLTASFRVLGEMLGDTIKDVFRFIRLFDDQQGITSFAGLMLQAGASISSVVHWAIAGAEALRALSAAKTGSVLAFAGQYEASMAFFNSSDTHLRETKANALTASNAFADALTRFKSMKETMRGESYGPFIPDKPVGRPTDPANDGAGSGKQSAIARFIQQMQEKIAALSQGEAAEREVHLSSLKGSNAERQAAEALIETLYKLTGVKMAEKAAQEEKTIADAAANRHMDKLIANQKEFLGAMDKTENGEKKLSELRKEGLRLLANEQITTAQFTDTMGALTLKYSDAAKALAAHNAEVDRAARKANNRHDEKLGFEKEIALLQEAVRLGKVSPETAFEQILEYKRKIDPMLDSMARLFEETANRITDSLVELAFTGKASLGDLVQFFMKEVAKILLYQNVIKPLLGQGGGGAMGWLGTLFGVGTAAAGGGATSFAGEAAMYAGSASGIGGSSSETFAAPASQFAAAAPSGGTTTIEVNIDSGGKADSKVASSMGPEIGMQIKSVVDQRIIEMSRPGGHIHRVMKGGQ